MKKVATLRGQWSIVLHTSPVIMQHICPGIIGSDSLRTLRQFSMMIFLLNRSMRNGVRKWKQNIVQPSGSVWTTERCLAACCKWSAWWWMMHPLVERTLYDNGPVQAVTLPSNQGGDWPWTKFVTITGLSIANRREWAWESWWLFCFFWLQRTTWVTSRHNWSSKEWGHLFISIFAGDLPVAEWGIRIVSRLVWCHQLRMSL